MTRLPIAVALLLLLPALAGAVCPPSCPIPGGGPTDQDCHAEFATTAMRLNYPPFDPAKPKAAKEVRCFDGDAGCDLDGAVDNGCTFPIDVCLLLDADPALPDCGAATVTDVQVSGASGDPDLQSLQAALTALLPGAGSGNVCTTAEGLRVPLKGPDGQGRFKRGKKKVRLKATTASGTDVDLLKLSCVPRGWPSHGYDHANRRATPLESTLDPTNAGLLVQKWSVDLQALEGASNNGVSSTPTVGGGLVHVTSWNGRVYGLKAKTGAVKWSYDTGSAPIIGVQSTAVLTADGRLVVGDSFAMLHCLDAKTGALLWKTSVGNPAIDHIWSSPQVAAGRVVIGIASHNDSPCTKGRLVAVDLDTGALLWSLQTVPDQICNTDTTIACTSDADCGGAPGSCVAARGAGVTATVAVDPSAATVYMATVGCFTFPSIGDEDSLFAIDATTGDVVWKYRTNPGEQFADGPPYRDYGFLNGPLLIDAEDGGGGTRRLVVAGSKNGTIYALDPPSGTPVWTQPVMPLPNFAGFGLFNGALGFANHTLFAALYDGGGSWPVGNDHLYAFRDQDGAVTWSTQIGESWGSVAIANGLVFVGNNDVAELAVHDAATGARLNGFPLPAIVSSGASIVDGTVYVGYGVFGAVGGVAAFGLP